MVEQIDKSLEQLKEFIENPENEEEVLKYAAVGVLSSGAMSLLGGVIIGWIVGVRGANAFEEKDAAPLSAYGTAKDAFSKKGRGFSPGFLALKALGIGGIIATGLVGLTYGAFRYFEVDVLLGKNKPKDYSNDVMKPEDLSGLSPKERVAVEQIASFLGMLEKKPSLREIIATSENNSRSSSPENENVLR